MTSNNDEKNSEQSWKLKFFSFRGYINRKEWFWYLLILLVFEVSFFNFLGPSIEKIIPNFVLIPMVLLDIVVCLWMFLVLLVKRAKDIGFYVNYPALSPIRNKWIYWVILFSFGWGFLVILFFCPSNFVNDREQKVKNA